MCPSPDEISKSKCTLGLLITAATAPYNVTKDDLIDFSQPGNEELVREMAKDYYAITKTITPKGSGGTGQSSLGALSMVSQDPNAPVVIAFRGTTSKKDVLSDIKLGTSGVVEKGFRDAAFQFYEEVRREYPYRQIILTGHSLGGHLAQYVAVRAYDEAELRNLDKNRTANDPKDDALLSQHLIQVRTFNTAPISTKHAMVLARHRELSEQFLNYRLSADAVSKLPIQLHYGTDFATYYKGNVYSAHLIKTLKETLSEELRECEVGGKTPIEQRKNLILEELGAVQSCYLSRVSDQWFSSHRAGSRNLEEINKAFPEIIQLIESNKYDQALVKMHELRNSKLDGDTAKGYIYSIITKTQDLAERTKQDRNEAKAVDAPKSEGPSNQQVQTQQNLKESMAKLREEFSEKTPDDTPKLQ